VSYHYKQVHIALWHHGIIFLLSFLFGLYIYNFCVIVLEANDKENCAKVALSSCDLIKSEIGMLVIVIVIKNNKSSETSILLQIIMDGECHCQFLIMYVCCSCFTDKACCIADGACMKCLLDGIM